MSKSPQSVIGIDLGRHGLKAVLLQRRGGGRIALTHYAEHVMSNPPTTPDQLAGHIRTVLKELGGSAKACAVAVSSSDSIIRIIEQPETPVHLLREALKLSGSMLLNQDCKNFVIDCDVIPSTAPANQVRYLVGGLPREEVENLNQVFAKSGCHPSTLQLGPVCNLNAFEFAEPEVFQKEAFLLVDIGYLTSTVSVGASRELSLVRSIDYGGKALGETLKDSGAASEELGIQALEQGDEMMLANARMSMMGLIRETISSIGFFEGRREEPISKVFVSGGLAKSKAILNILNEEIQRPCQSWNPCQKFEVALSGSKKEKLSKDCINLNVACGAAAELLKGV